jgi:tripartite-type tricarboxylate transporter receptor subunit TctC
VLVRHARLIALAAALAAMIPLHAPSPAVAQTDDVFAGKSLAIIIGFGSGGGYDLWGRTLARHIGRHLPGRPAVVPQNMLGAGSLNAANHLYAVAPRDGTAMGIIARDAVLAPLIGQKGARFDATKFSWIGSPTMETNICIVYHTARVQTFDQLLHQELIVGATGFGSGASVYPRALNALMGTKFKLITGFPSSSDVFLAMERGEIEGICESLDSVAGRRPDWLTSGKAKILLQGGIEADPHLKDVPFILDRARSDEERQAVRLLYAGQGFGRPFLAPPELPPQRLTMLRDAFNATMADPAFAEDVHKQKLDLDPRTGEQLAALATSIYATPKEIVDKVASLINP